MQCLFFFFSHFVATTFDWHLFWPVEMNRPQMIYNKAGPRAVWTLYDRSGLCESVSVCLSQCVSSLFPAQPQRWDRYVHTFHSVVPTAVKNAPDPRAHVMGDFFYILLLKEQPWLMHILLSPLCCWILWSFMQRDWMCVWGGGTQQNTSSVTFVQAYRYLYTPVDVCVFIDSFVLKGHFTKNDHFCHLFQSCIMKCFHITSPFCVSREEHWTS